MLERVIQRFLKNTEHRQLSTRLHLESGPGLLESDVETRFAHDLEQVTSTLQLRLGLDLCLALTNNAHHSSKAGQRLAGRVADDG